VSQVICAYSGAHRCEAHEQDRPNQSAGQRDASSGEEAKLSELAHRVGPTWGYPRGRGIDSWHTGEEIHQNEATKLTTNRR